MSHSFYELYYHIIWATKGREFILDERIKKILKSFIIDKIAKLKCECLELNMYKNHLHLLTTIKPSLGVAEFVNLVKGSSSYKVNVQIPNFNFRWQIGYGILSLSKKGIPFVRDYIQHQPEHHNNNTIIPILEYVPEDK